MLDETKDWGRFLIWASGIMCFSLGLWLVIVETPKFSDSKFEGFWQDVEAYHLNLESKKPIEELTQRYGEPAVVKYIEKATFLICIPNEDAAFANAVGFLIYRKKFPSAPSLPVLLGILFVAGYTSVVLTGRQIQYWVTGWICRSWEACKARKNYFSSLARGKTQAIAVAFVLTLWLSSIHTAHKISPVLLDKGITPIDITMTMLVLAYFGGLWMLLLSFIVDSIFLVLGQNPHLSLLDDLIVLIIMIPIFYSLYQNSWLSIAATTAAGLGGGVFIKWFSWHSEYVK